MLYASVFFKSVATPDQFVLESDDIYSIKAYCCVLLCLLNKAAGERIQPSRQNKLLTLNIYVCHGDIKFVPASIPTICITSHSDYIYMR